MALSEAQLTAVDMLVNNPEEEFTKIAQECGVTPKTIYNWRQLPEFQAELSKRGLELIDGALFKRAASEDVNAMKLWYQRFGHLGAEDGVDPLARYFNLTSDEKEQVMIAVAEWYLGSTKAKGKEAH